MRILLTNDDGIHAPGIAALREALEGLGEITVVAPHKVQSAMSHSVTLHKPIVARAYDGVEPTTGVRVQGTSVEGRPADCVKLATCELMKDGIDLVISGMNAGANIGVHVLYSGTVGAAREGAFLGIPSIAVSLHLRKEAPRWREAAKHARRAIDALLTQELDPHTVMNVNVPGLDGDIEPQGIKLVPLSTSAADDGYEATDQGDGVWQYHIRDQMTFLEHQPGTDVEALFDRWVTVTPLRFDLTCDVGMKRWIGVF